MTLRQQIELLQARERELRLTANERADQIREQHAQISNLGARLKERDAEIARLDGVLKDRSKAHEIRAVHQMGIVEELKKSCNLVQTQLAKAHAENEKLRKSLTAKTREVVEHERVGEEVRDDADDASNDDGNSSNEGDEDGDGFPDAIHDGLVYCCSECGFEVVDGDCQMCWTKHHWDEEMGKDSVFTQNEALVQDRQLSPRGTTPVRDVGKPSIHRDYCSSLSGVDRSEEYVELLRRGATRLMCETFCMEFKQATGIVAWADSSLYETFAGPDMQKGDFWKIHLGRRIELDEDDLDGAQFLEDFLEDALLFPLRSDLSNRTHERWETIEESPGIWVTRPMAALEVEVNDDSDEVDDNGSDCDEYGDSDAYSDTYDKLQKRDYFYQQSDAIRADAYDTDDDEDEQTEAGEADVKVEDEAQDNEDSDVQMSDPGWSFNPREADATWPTVRKDDDDADVEDAKVNEGEQLDDDKSKTAVNADSDKDEEEYGNMAVDDFEVSDSADSDFDSDEVLSGDEAIGLKYL